MTQEIVTLQIKKGQREESLKHVSHAQKYISSTDGFVNLTLNECVGFLDRFIMMVDPASLGGHTVDFRMPEGYTEWMKLVQPYYEPFPELLHFSRVEI